MILSLAIAIAIFAFPFFEDQYVHRFNGLLFIPQGLLMINLIRSNQKFAQPFSIALVLLTSISIFLYFSEEKKPCIDDLAFRDLQNIDKYLINNRSNTIIIARHGLEFWTAWTLNVKVGQDRNIDITRLDKYTNIIILQQKNETLVGPMGNHHLPGAGHDNARNHPSGSPPRMHPPTGAPMGPPDEIPMGPPLPENFKLLYSSPYFNAYQNSK